MKSSTLSACAVLALVAFVAAPATAQISWDPVVAETKVGDLIGGPIVVFDAMPYPDSTTNNDNTFFTNGNGDLAAGKTTGSVPLDAVFNSHGWNAAGTTITLDGLTSGSDYMLQLLGAGDNRNCCATRNQAADDGMGNISGDFSRSGPGSVVGSFTAAAETQDIMIVSGVENGVDPGLSGYILTDGAGEFIRAVNYVTDYDQSITVRVPEPATIVLLGLAAGGLLAIRRRK